jgi:hypothetical protein
MPMSGSPSADKGLRLESLYNVRLIASHNSWLRVSPPGSGSCKRNSSRHLLQLAVDFVIVMTTPVIINRLQWKAYLISICTNPAVVPLVHFCYPEMANLALEKIDYLFNNPDEGAVKLSRELHKERKCGKALRLSD